MADYQITCITLSGSKSHDRITQVGNASVPWSLSTAEAVKRIDAKTDTFYVMDAYGRRANVGVVRPAQGLPYLRTFADSVWTDNLLSLGSC
ncbi:MULTISPECIES: DUF3892 domain-containing protein [Pseudomonas syringae group]|uniref:DUF3892 domain-containing protein n=3 Tax=Pseudomonas TaxID=286 RepID=A0AAD0GP86_9PSED|nr:DUF3892 domain-containing protein [Pseudomonas avellanae]POP85389.1 DUF3892 domain-containing protein [Pseudomonas amygdali pv. morsprunorum]SOS32791.1 hypothetical protein CFBP6411_01431 [Pseudomonas syringae group genomosp. 3]SPF11747.1 hypothetical protein PSCFBP3800_01703 [Pseudomonas syringae group genomosp. 3]